MQLQYSQPVDISDVYISGDVTVHPSAVLAPGVILQAAPDSRIVIGARACIGMGAVLKAYQGDLKVENGAVLGPGVLFIGCGKIGDNACIGAATTVFNTSVDSGVVIPPGSLVGDSTRQVEVIEAKSVPVSEPPSALTEEPSTPPQSSKPKSENHNGLKPSSPQPQKSQVFGQVYVNELLFTLFPHRNSLNRRQQDE